MRFKLILAWYDIWFGAYYDRANEHLYLMIPFIGIRISFECRHKWEETSAEDLGWDADIYGKISKCIKCDDISLSEGCQVIGKVKGEGVIDFKGKE